MLTQERADIISQFLADDQERARMLLDLEPEEALEKINAAGHDFTVEELIEYCNALKLAIADGELNADDLDNVSGGVVVSVGVMIACGVGGFVAGFAVSKKW